MNNIFISHYNRSDIPQNFDLVLLSDFDSIPNNSIEEIFLTDVIGGFSDDNIGVFLIQAIDKLVPDGILYIQDIDIEQISLYISKKVLPITDKKLFYAYDRTNMFYLRYVVKIIQNIDSVNIEHMRFVNGYEFFMKIKKNNA